MPFRADGEADPLAVRLAEERYAAAQLVNSAAPTDQLEAAGRRLQAIEALAASYAKTASADMQKQQRHKNVLAWTATGAVAFLTVGVLAWYPVSRASIRAKLVVSGVHLVLAEPWRAISLLEASRLEVEHADYVSAPGIGLPPRRADPANIGAIVEAQSLWISQVELPEGVNLFLKLNNNQLELTVRSAFANDKAKPSAPEVRLDILARGTTKAYAMDAMSDTVLAPSPDVTATGSFGRRLAGRLPLKVVVAPKQPWVMRGLRPSRMVFSEETADPYLALNTVSTIESGSLEILDAKRTALLERGDRLVLDGLKIERLEVAAGNPISILMTASAARVTGGPTGFEVDLRPSLLEWLYNLGPLQLIWTAVGVLLGTFVTVRSRIMGAGS